MSKVKQLPVSVKLTKDHIYVIFDESILNGYKLNEKLFVKNDKQHNRKVFKDHEELLSKGKIKNRFCGVDLNPEYIGLSICDKGTNGDVKIIYKECIDLTELNKNLGLPSEDERQIHQANKRKHEICESWKYVFGLCRHYKVANFVMEELEFKGGKSLGKVANRKCKNH